MLSIGAVIVGVSDMRRAVEFWTKALGYVPQDEVTDAWTFLEPPSGKSGPGLGLQPSEAPVEHHPRIHLDLHARDTADQAAEVERLVSLGAQRVDWDMYPENPDFVVLADPDGNRFCIIDTSRG